jgi:hypothetical protein
MKKIFRNTWFQVIFFGLLIGFVIILLDNKYKFFDSGKDVELYKGPIEVDKEKTYFTQAEYSGFEYNFGKVKEGDTVTHVFKIKNIGKEPLIIYKSHGSCECIAAFSSGRNIMPDSTEDIIVNFKTKGRKGSQNRTVSIITNTEPSEAILTFKGEVE